MRLRDWPILAVAAALLIGGAWELLAKDTTRAGGAGVLLGSGLTILAAWVWSELRD